MHPDVLVGASAFVAPDCNQHLSISICGHHLGSVHVLNKLPRHSIGGKCSCAAAAPLLASPIFIGALAPGPGNERSAVSLDLQIWRCLDTVTPQIHGYIVVVMDLPRLVFQGTIQAPRSQIAGYSRATKEYLWASVTRE